MAGDFKLCIWLNSSLSLCVQHLLTEESWKAALSSEFSKPYFKKLEAFLQGEWAQHQVFPAREHIFR